MDISSIRFVIPTIMLIICCFVFEKRFREVMEIKKKVKAMVRAGETPPKDPIPLEKDYRTICTLIGALGGFLLSTLDAVTVYEGTLYGCFFGMVIGMMIKRKPDDENAE